jgi:conjugative transposon TraN protein
MTHRIFIIVVLVLGLSRYGKAQDSIKSIDVTYSKTTSLVFQYPIVSVDRGSEDVIAQKVKGVENTLLIKAARKSFPETNLTVITGDGSLHHFYVTYSDRPISQTFRIDSTEFDVEFSNKVNIKKFEKRVARILRKRNGGKCQSRSKFKMRFTLRAIYIDNNVVFYDFEIKNRSNVNYDIQSLRFFIRDVKRPKRTASQENELQPVFVSERSSGIKGNSALRVVYALQKFTIPDAKSLDIELFEKNGGRNLKLRIDNQTIVKAEKLLINQ